MIIIALYYKRLNKLENLFKNFFLFIIFIPLIQLTLHWVTAFNALDFLAKSTVPLQVDLPFESHITTARSTVPNCSNAIFKSSFVT